MSPKFIFLTFLSTVAIATTAIAHDKTKPVGEIVSNRNGVEHTTMLFKTGRHLETVTCAQFNVLDESFKPQAISIAENYGRKGNAHPTETVSGVDRITPAVLESCRERPGDHVLAHVRHAMHTTAH